MANNQDYAVEAIQQGQTKTLPSSWYYSEKIMELEKRAIFHKAWFLAAPISQLECPGDTFDVHVGGVKVDLKVEEDGQVVATGPYGPVHVHLTDSGCVFVNLESSEKPSTTFEEYFPGLEPILKTFPFRKYKLYKRFTKSAKMNWKMYTDGMTEYHCFVAHPGLAKLLNVRTFKTENRGNFSQSWVDPIKPENVAEKDFMGSEEALFLVLYPMAGVNCFVTGWSHIYPSPLSSGETCFTNDFYLEESLSLEEKEEFYNESRKVDLEDWDLCLLTQKNIETGVYTSGNLHPVRENGVLHYQYLTRKIVMEHGAMEKRLGRMIDPLIPTAV